MKSEQERFFIGLDVGGANIKIADSLGNAQSQRFALWLSPHNLSTHLSQLLRSFCGQKKAIACLAVTMTGELADCFFDRQIGVSHIVDHVTLAAKAQGIEEVWFYGVDGLFHCASEAKTIPDCIAAANWHALASYVAQDIATDGWLIDVGSTTTDIIPFNDRKVCTRSQTDHHRLCSGELIYVGCRRTPVCAVVDQLDLAVGKSSSDLANVMNEVFATMDDVSLILRHKSEDPADTDTADGQPRTVLGSINRIARMIGLDHRQVDLPLARLLAQQVHDSASKMIRDGFKEAYRRKPFSQHPIQTLVISGHGQHLISMDEICSIMNQEQMVHVIDLVDQLGPIASRCAPAYALAKLAENKINDSG